MAVPWAGGAPSGGKGGGKMGGKMGGKQGPRKSFETRYLPMIVKGIPVLIHQGGNVYLADNSQLQASTAGIQFRIHKNLDAKEQFSMAWDTSVEGVDEGDGWLRVQLPVPEEKRMQGKGQSMQPPNQWNQMNAADPMSMMQQMMSYGSQAQNEEDEMEEMQFKMKMMTGTMKMMMMFQELQGDWWGGGGGGWYGNSGKGSGKQGKGATPWGRLYDPNVDMTGKPGPNGEDPSEGRWSFESAGNKEVKKWKWKKPHTSFEEREAKRQKKTMEQQLEEDMEAGLQRAIQTGAAEAAAAAQSW